MNCDFVIEPVDDRLNKAICRLCGRSVVVPSTSETVAATCRAARHLPKVAVGDLVETMLTSVGITKERVQQWTRTKDCGCKKRQAWLNQWGYKQQDRMERLLNKAAQWYGIS